MADLVGASSSALPAVRWQSKAYRQLGARDRQELWSAHTTWCTVLGHVSRSVGDVGLCDLGLGVGECVVLQLTAHSATGDAAVLYRITPPAPGSDGAVDEGSLDFI